MQNMSVNIHVGQTTRAKAIALGGITENIFLGEGEVI